MSSHNSSSQAIHWKSIFFEAFFEVLGVVLALTANGIREEYRNQRRAESALASILDELAGNQGSVSMAVSYHSQLLDTLENFTSAYGNDPSRAPGVRVFSKGFIFPTRIVSRAWEAATTTGVIEHMNYSQVLLLAQLYENQRSYDTQKTTFASELYTRLFDGGVQSILQNYQNLSAIIGSFVFRECELARAYADVLPQFGVDSTAVAAPMFCQYMPGR